MVKLITIFVDHKLRKYFFDSLYQVLNIILLSQLDKAILYIVILKFKIIDETIGLFFCFPNL